MNENCVNFEKLGEETQKCTPQENKKSFNIKGYGMIAIILVVILIVVGSAYVGTQYWFQRDVSQEDSSSMEQTVETVITSISQLSKEDMESYLMISEFELDYTMMTANIPMTGKCFEEMVKTWIEVEKKYGEYVSYEDCAVVGTRDGAKLTTTIEFEEKSVLATFVFDEKNYATSFVIK